MTLLVRIIALTMSAVTIGCSTHETVEPTQQPRAPESVLSSLLVSPSSMILDRGSSAEFSLQAFDQHGAPMQLSGHVSYTSEKPEVARLNENTGQITAFNSGTTNIIVTVITALQTKSAVMRVTVRPQPLPGDIVMGFGAAGWIPGEADILAGSVVHFQTSSPSWSGTPVSDVWFYPKGSLEYETIRITDGFGSHRFDRPGEYYVCAGGCWDPPDWATIRVHPVQVP